MEQRTDAELVNSARNGDKQAFGHLVDRYQAMTYRIALQMARHDEVARDLMQESILQAYLSLERLRHPDRFGSWLYGITLNVCRGYFRDQKIDFLSLESLTGGLRYNGPLFDAGATDPLVLVEARELHGMVQTAVEELSEKNRKAVLLFYFESLTVREIAALLAISVSAVKSRLYQSRQQLQQSLAALYKGERITASISERTHSMIQVTIADIVVDVKTGHRIVVLVDEEKRQALPIWIGPFEADSILIVLKDVTISRPITHDFLANILKAADMELEEVRIEAIKEDVFYAIAKLRNRDIVHEVDTRPSDALALAVRTGTPIYIAEDVMTKAGLPIPTETQELSAIESWYYSPLRQAKTEFPAEELDKQLHSPVSAGKQEKAAAPAQLSEEEEAQRKEEQLKDRQELVAFVFGEL